MPCQMYFMTSSLLNVSPLFPDQLLTCRSSFFASIATDVRDKGLWNIAFFKLILNLLLCRRLYDIFRKKKKNEMLRTIAFSLFTDVLTLNLFGKGFQKNNFIHYCASTTSNDPWRKGKLMEGNK